jgi:hypothetical protein
MSIFCYKGLAEDENLMKLQEKLGEDFAEPNHRKFVDPLVKILE